MGRSNLPSGLGLITRWRIPTAPWRSSVRLRLARTPFLLVPGNHESLHDTDGSERLWSGGSYFSSFVAQQPAPGNWFGLRYGNCAFIGLDSTAIATHGGNGAALREGWGPASPQHAFLLAELEAAQRDPAVVWTVVFFHFPPFVSADYQVSPMQAALCPLLERFSVDLVLTSHTMVYERSHPLRAGRLDLDKGTVYVVCGGAGVVPEWEVHFPRAGVHRERAPLTTGRGGGQHHAREPHCAFSLAVPHCVQVGRWRRRAVWWRGGDGVAACAGGGGWRPAGAQSLRLRGPALRQHRAQ